MGQHKHVQNPMTAPLSPITLAVGQLCSGLALADAMRPMAPVSFYARFGIVFRNLQPRRPRS
jgi:hypothetical protein